MKAILAFVILATTITLMGCSNPPTDKTQWESPCGDKVVLGHRIDSFGQTQYVCSE